MRNSNQLEKIDRDLRSLVDENHGYIKAGFPGFHRLFGRDSLIVSWQLLNERPEICRATLEIMSRYQGKKSDLISEEEPGKILHETDIGKDHHPKYPWIPFPYFGSIDATPLYVILHYKYHQKTGDDDFLNKFLPGIETAADWIVNRIENDDIGFLRYQRKQEKGQLYHQGWKDGFLDHLKIKAPVAIVEAQGYAYLALKCAADLLPKRSEKFLNTAQKLKENFNEKFWMDDKKYFSLAIDGDGRQKSSITSNPGHLLFAGILDREKSDFVIDRIFKEDLWTPFGIRTHSTNEPDFEEKSYHLGSVWPHDNWMIAVGCKEMGKDAEYKKIREAILMAFDMLGYIPECYGVSRDGKLLEIDKAQKIQAWSLGAVNYFLIN